MRTTTRTPRTRSTTGRHRLNDRDRAGVQAVAEQRAMRLDDLARLLAAKGGRPSQPLGTRTARDVVARWVAAGLVTTEPYPGQGPAMVLPTVHGAALARLGRPTPPSWTDLPHTLTTAAVAVRYASSGSGAWVAEQRLRKQLEPGEHLPDGLWLTSTASRVAVEVERNAKAGHRWSAIVSELLATYDGVHYWISDTTRPAWERWAAHRLVPSDHARIVLCSLEAEGVAR